MSRILKQIYNDLIKTSYIEEDIEMKDLRFISWENLSHDIKKIYILDYMKNNNIPGDISQYTFKNISFDKHNKKITNLMYYKRNK